MNRGRQLLCVHTTALFVLVVGGAFVVAGWLPPPSPSLSPAETAARLGHFHIRIAAAMLALGSPLFLAPAVAIAAQLRRIEGRRHVLADFQVLSAAVGVLAIELPAFYWLAITYRPDVAPGISVTVNDVSWFLLIGGYPSALTQCFAIGICILGKGAGDVYPRWLGYANLWLGMTLLPGILIPFFKTGPFTWNGIVGFWVVFSGFFLWVMVMWVYTAKAINRDQRTVVPADAAELTEAV